MRRPDKAGTWYSDDPDALREEVDGCVARGEELYGAEEVSAGGKPVAVVVPHAGLFFSGAVAGAAFARVRKAWERVDAFVVFGACHRAALREPAVWAAGSWRTPIGDIEVDGELAEAFIEGGVGRENPGAHAGDNAVELQTPFIKHLFPEAKIVPIAMGFFHDAAGIGAAASGIARLGGGVRGGKTGKNIIAVASTDLTHYGTSFGLAPAGTGEAALRWVRENDARFLDALAHLELDEIVPVAERDGSACGAGAAAAAAGWARERGCPRGRVLAATNSYEVAPDGRAEHIVGYAAVSFDA